MRITATFTAKVSPPAQVLAARDVLKATRGKGSVMDLYEVPGITAWTDQQVDSMRGKLASVAAKAGLKPVNSDVLYGLHGDLEGSVEAWFQIWVST